MALGISHFQKLCLGFLIFKSCAWDSIFLKFVIGVSYFCNLCLGFLVFKSCVWDFLFSKVALGISYFQKLRWGFLISKSCDGDFVFSTVALEISYFQKLCLGFLIIKSCAWDFYFPKVAMGISCFQKLLYEFFFLRRLQSSRLNKGRGVIIKKDEESIFLLAHRPAALWTSEPTQRSFDWYISKQFFKLKNARKSIFWDGSFIVSPVGIFRGYLPSEGL